MTANPVATPVETPRSRQHNRRRAPAPAPPAPVRVPAPSGRCRRRYRAPNPRARFHRRVRWRIWACRQRTVVCVRRATLSWNVGRSTSGACGAVLLRKPP